MCTLDNTNLFSAFISNDVIKYTRKIENKLYTLVVPIDNRADAMSKLVHLSSLTNEWFIQLSELSKKVAIEISSMADT